MAHLENITHAASRGDLESVTRFCEQNPAAKETTDKDGRTPFHLASLYGHLDIVKYLTNEAHADASSRDNAGWTPLHWAALKGHLDIVKFLCETALADTEAVGRHTGRTPLHFAAENGHLDVVKYLCEEAKVNTEVCTSLIARFCPAFHCFTERALLGLRPAHQGRLRSMLRSAEVL